MKKWSRREFTRHAGLATLFTPFLSMLDGKPAGAAGAGKAKYFLMFYAHGTDPNSWAPKGGDGGITSFSAMTEPLSAIKDSVILVDNLSGGGTSGSHGSPGGICGMGYGAPTHISVDQFISDGLKANGIKTQIANLIMTGPTTQPHETFYRAGQKLTPLTSPTTAFNAIFSGVGTSSPPSGSTPMADAGSTRRKSILDLMTTQLGQLSQTLGATERAKLEIHAESIRQLEARLETQSTGGGVVVGGSCSVPAKPGEPSETLMASSMMLQLAVQAFACDLTRVASVQFGHHQGTDIKMAEAGGPGDWHNGFLHSDQPPYTRLVTLEKWLCKEFVKAAELLKAIPAPDGDGTLYDQTLMFWARDMGDGLLHTDANMRFVFAGGAGGYLRHNASGRYVNGGGARHNQALLSAVEAMGITDFANFGDGSAKTAMPQLTT
jgi:Protein of unknown function (DUF1552)